MAKIQYFPKVAVKKRGFESRNFITVRTVLLCRCIIVFIEKSTNINCNSLVIIAYKLTQELTVGAPASIWIQLLHELEYCQIILYRAIMYVINNWFYGFLYNAQKLVFGLIYYVDSLFFMIQLHHNKFIDLNQAKWS